MYKCEQCGKEHDGTFGSGRFCCRSCSNKWVALHQSDEAKSKKVSAGICNLIHEGAKLRKCNVCGKEFRSNVYEICNECRHSKSIEIIKSSKDYFDDYVECPYCGEPLHLINSLHLKQHNKTMSDMFEEYGSNYKYVSNNFSKNKSETGIRQYNLNNVTGHPRGTLVEVSYKGSVRLLRSLWEKDLFDILIYLGVDFEYESLRIPYKHPQRKNNSVYIPDFYIPSLNLVLEVKPKEMIDFICISKKDATEYLGYSYEFITRDCLTIESIKYILDSYRPCPI